MRLRLRLGRLALTAVGESRANWRLTAQRGAKDPFLDVTRGTGGLSEDEQALAYLDAEIAAHKERTAAVASDKPAPLLTLVRGTAGSAS